MLEAWRGEGALDRTIHLPFGERPATWSVGQQVADLVVHGWDVAKATGQPEVSVPEEAPLYDRLAAWFGRDPALPMRAGEAR